MWTSRQTIEIFHLLFLRAFGARVDKALFVLNGGCNLQFFHKSIRHSEDMDLDIHTMSVGASWSCNANSRVHALGHDVQEGRIVWSTGK
jgi:hypothetical protein